MKNVAVKNKELLNTLLFFSAERKGQNLRASNNRNIVLNATDAFIELARISSFDGFHAAQSRAASSERRLAMSDALAV